VETTPEAIVDNSNRPVDNNYYTLYGVKVEHPTKGIYIHRGKKIIIK
jgi:dextranase